MRQEPADNVLLAAHKAAVVRGNSVRTRKSNHSYTGGTASKDCPQDREPCLRSPHRPRSLKHSCEERRALVQCGKMPIKQRNKTHHGVFGHEPDSSTCKAENAVEKRRFLSPVFRLDQPEGSPSGAQFCLCAPFSRVNTLLLRLSCWLQQCQPCWNSDCLYSFQIREREPMRLGTSVHVRQSLLGPHRQ